ncbi:2-oxo-tetronate isomerase [Massilia sp. YMA4]|uniref:2-oxo-tetronate isomerase n=1 Tax=Massilia sp. YMA4 TaxID=1593482 RepID=UPI000DD17ED7|nr:2-oxo-tetronate isomerase [Massilia sp. YMA4]AXA91621.1 hydroxypyruvate isomerase [Massilia sp. YMA4]
MPRFAANLSMLFTEHSFLDRFAAARDAGFEGVEFLFPYEYDPDDIARRLEDSGLQLALHNLPPGDWEHGDRGNACDPRRMSEFRASVQTALRYATRLNVPYVHCMAGILPPGLPSRRAREAYIVNLQYAAELFAPHGIGVLIEPINGFDMPGYFLQRSADALDILAACARPNLYLQYDIYHMYRMEEPLEDSLRACLPSIRHVQLADAPGRHEPGTGQIDYPPLLRLLDDLGYEGWVGCEYRPRDNTVAGLGWRTVV